MSFEVGDFVSCRYWHYMQIPSTKEIQILVGKVNRVGDDKKFDQLLYIDFYFTSRWVRNSDLTLATEDDYIMQILANAGA